MKTAVRRSNDKRPCPFLRPLNTPSSPKRIRNKGFCVRFPHVFLPNFSTNKPSRWRGGGFLALISARRPYGTSDGSTRAARVAARGTKASSHLYTPNHVKPTFSTREGHSPRNIPEVIGPKSVLCVLENSRATRPHSRHLSSDVFSLTEPAMHPEPLPTHKRHLAPEFQFRGYWKPSRTVPGLVSSRSTSYAAQTAGNSVRCTAGPP